MSAASTRSAKPVELPYAGRCATCGRDSVWWDDAAVCMACNIIEDDCTCTPNGEKILDDFMSGA